MTMLNDGAMLDVVTALGSKAGNVRYTGKLKKPKELLDAYNSSWIVKKFIDKTTADMLKVPREFGGDFDEKLLATAKKAEKRLNVEQIKKDALSWASLLGECLVVAVTDIHSDKMHERLSDHEEILKFIVLPRGDYSANDRIDDDITSLNFGMPLCYTIKSGNPITIHHSRCHRIKLGKQGFKDNKDGVSDLQAAFESIKLFDTAITSTADIIQESNVDVLFIPKLHDMLSAQGSDYVATYLTAIKSMKSSSNIIALDSGDSETQSRWEQKTANYSGLSDIISKMANVLAGALDRPITVLFGQSASGFASGEEDNKAYYETINGFQESRLRPLQNFIDKFILNKIIPNEIEFDYPSIDSMSESEEADIFQKYATAFSTLATAQLFPDHAVHNEMIARGMLKNTTLEELKDGAFFE